jgi:membrane-associated protease RseP (regulator of RpoE activity)
MPNSPPSGPPSDLFSSVFRIYETKFEGDSIIYYGEPLSNPHSIIEFVWPLFREHGYEPQLTQQLGEYVLVAKPIYNAPPEFPWLQLLLFIATILSTLYAGSMWYYIPDPLSNPLSLLQAWPFAAAVIGVLAVHELGHYVVSKYYHVDATLPYFIPMPTFIGTLGALIRIRGRIPTRTALFDIGIAGPIAGLLATIAITAIGLSLDPISVPTWVDSSTPGVFTVEFGYPILFKLIAILVGSPGTENVFEVLMGTTKIGYSDPTMAFNPVVFGGWVGMFVTFLNLLPVGQLDGGHILRGLLGQRAATVSALIPGFLFGLAAFLYYFGEKFFTANVSSAVSMWLFWGILTLFLAQSGYARPIKDEPLDLKRKALGISIFLIGFLCFTPIPLQILG